MIAVDTNILVYAHRRDLPFHHKSRLALAELAESGRLWCLPWPCVHEFLAIITNVRLFKTPTPLAGALKQVEAWLECPTLRCLSEGLGYWTYFKDVALRGRFSGGAMHDARIAALCLQAGVTELWTADRDFTRVKGLKLINPALG